MEKIYIDTSVYNRLFDDQSQPKIRMETIGFIAIMKLIELRKLNLVSSSVLEYENERNPLHYRKIQIRHYLSLADFYQKLNKSIKERAGTLEKEGIDPIDALHLASAEEAGARYFLTCDEAIIKKYKDNLITLNPIDFIFKSF